MKIAVVGCGYVGLVSGLCFANFGFDVALIDKNQDVVDKLRDSKLHIYEEGLLELLQKGLCEGRVSFHNQPDVMQDADLIVIAVGTPESEDGSADMRYVDEVVEQISRIENPAVKDRYVMIKSTVPIGTAQRVARKLSSNVKPDNRESQTKFHIISNPEFLREGSAVQDFMYPDRIIIGCDSASAKELMKRLYHTLTARDVDMLISDNTSAELIKYGANSYLATRIAFINEISDIAYQVGANINDISLGMGMDKRIGVHYLQPGPGYGGSCFPKDTKSLSTIAAAHDVDSYIVNATIKSNEKRISRMVQRLKKIFDTALESKVMAVLGLAFKGNTDDTRDSPSIRMILELLNAGAIVRVYDPLVKYEDNIKGKVEYCSDPVSVAAGADCLIVMTEWDEFAHLDLGKIKSVIKDPKIFDLRNMINVNEAKLHGFNYIGL